jgi:hypothetical protein
MDINLLKKRLATLQNPKGQNKERSQTIWRPAIGKHSVRIVPSAYDRTNPFKEVYIYYEIGNRAMPALTNFGETDPIVEFTQKLRKSSDKENWQLAKKLEPKMRVFVPVIVRGEEDKGVRLWEFGKQVYMDLLAIAEDEDVGDFTDPIEGRDLTVETQGKETTGLMYNTSTVRIRTKITPLSDDAEKVKLWLKEQPDPMSLFKKFTYDEMKTALLNHLNPEEEIKEQADSVQPKDSSSGDLPWETEVPAAAPAPKTFSLSNKKSDLESKIDDLFRF